MADVWLTTEELAERLHLAPKTLWNWNLQGVGPTPVKVGRRLLYRVEAVEAWEREQETLARAR
jgi:predicted DNA-binding transcriptional regulator AlpA